MVAHHEAHPRQARGQQEGYTMRGIFGNVENVLGGDEFFVPTHL